ncbi:MAG TPA: DUF1570 domain-containing protein [Gemmataceae bacterium]|jgi:hypothetical protein|nr:DUF1570 domain-containing protein [Gemmataceae bacterium]
MTRPLRVLAVLAIIAFPASAAPPPTLTPDWAFDILKLKNGVTHKGLLLEDRPTEVLFRIIGRKPGRPTVWFNFAFKKEDILKLERLTDDERAALKAKLEDIDPSPEAEARRTDRIDLQIIDWAGQKNAGLRYDSDYFSLISDAPEEVVRGAAYRLENVYAAYARFLPPRYAGGAPTVIQVYQSIEAYQKAVPGGDTLKNPAFYEPSANRVVCGTDLLQLGIDLGRSRDKTRKDLEELSKQEAEIIRLYGKKPDLARYLQPFKDLRSQYEKAAKLNEGRFETATRQLFQTLYHEAFHAYVGNFVYPPADKDRPNCPGELPRWLNEGMAQVFETAIFEAGELRIGHADRIRLEKAQDALAKKELLSLQDVLTAKRDVFVVTHAGKRPEADRAYVATWALASYLMFDRRVLGTSALDEFVKAVHTGKDPVKAFEALVGQPAAEFEKAYHGWLRRLLPNGALLQTGGK